MDVMENKTNTLIRSVLWDIMIAIVLSLMSCGRIDDVNSPGEGRSNLIVRFTLPEGNSAGQIAAAGDGYEDGSDIENYIDVHNSCRVLFFSINNTFLGALDRQVVTDFAGTGYRQYTLSGIPPADLPSDFKIMIAANWPDMSAIDNAIVGATTIDDICHSVASQYEVSPGFTLDVDNGKLMPFFGIRSYSGITIMPGTTTLPGAVTMLRAMAKIEVVFDDSVANIPGSVSLCRFNVKGYCAPAGVYDQNGYGQGEDWDSDYLHRLHLVTVDNNNEPGASGRRADFSAGTPGTCRWTAYVPEYRNLMADGSPAPDEAYIEIKLSSQSADEEPFKIYFSNYSGASSANTTLPRYNIERNNIYRFNVSLHHGELIITARPWNYRPQPEINA